jgi:RNA polymerase sigma factor for flagellar operon FliA
VGPIGEELIMSPAPPSNSLRPSAAPDPKSAAAAPAHELIDSCRGLVRSLAWKIHRKLPPHVELDDLVAYGEVGLAQAAADFDSSRGVRFVTYAHHRIRGAIFDGLSKMAWFSRQDYHASRYEHMANDLLREHDDQGGEAGSSSLEHEVRWLRDVSGSLMVVYLAAGEDARHRHLALDDEESQPARRSMLDELRAKLHESIDELPFDAAALIRSTYFEGLTLQEAGVKLGISKAWASRLHAKTLQRLARSLRMAGVAD